MYIVYLAASHFLTFKAPITTAADDILNYLIISFFFFFFFSKKVGVSLGTIHIKCQILFSLKNKKKMSSATTFAWHFKGLTGFFGVFFFLFFVFFLYIYLSW